MKSVKKYYNKKFSKIMTNFDRQEALFRKILKPKLGKAKSDLILLETKKEYKTLIPEIMVMEAQKNIALREVKNISMALAFVKVMRYSKYSDDQIIDLIYDLHEEYYRSSLKGKMNLLRSIFNIMYHFPFNKVYKFVLKKYECNLKKHNSNSTLLFNYVEGEGKAFDYGIDIVKCPICEMWKKHDAVDLLRYVCLFDFFKSALMNSGLTRTMTISEGYEKCDNRFKPGEKPHNKQITKFKKMISDDDDDDFC